MTLQWNEPVWLTTEQLVAEAKEARQQHEESLRRWPMSQRRDRCMNCGAFMRTPSYEHTRCKNCGESYLSLQ